MTWLRRLRDVVSRRRLTAERTEELQFHFDMEVEAGLRRGLDQAEARRQAVLRAGRVSTGIESVRAAFGSRLLDAGRLDLRQAWRALGRSRGFAAGVVAVIASTVAISTLIFVVLDGVVLRPLPYPEPERLVRVYDAVPQQPQFPVSIGHYLDYREHAASLESIGLYTGQDVVLGDAGQPPQRLVGVLVTADFFRVLGAAPMLGRAFNEEDLRGDGRNVVISASLWRARFQADPAIVGRVLRLDRLPATVVGVMPDGFEHVGGEYRSPPQGDSVDVWLPLKLDLSEQQLRSSHFTNAVGRLAPGVTLDEARADLDRLATAYEQRYPNAGPWRARLEPLDEVVTGSVRSSVWLLAAAGGLVLLIAGANVGGLCLARAVARRDELALRRALGAGRWHVARVGLVETLMVGFVGGLVGLGVAALALPIIRAFVPSDFPRLHAIVFTPSAAVFAVAAAGAIAAMAGLLPAFGRGTRLSAGPRSTSGPEGIRLRRLLVVGESALAGLLCAGALFLLRSYEEVTARDHGFEAGGVLTFQLTMPEAVGPEAAVRNYAAIRDALLTAPGVAAMGFTSNLPWSGYDENSSFQIPGREDGDEARPSARYQFAGPGFFEAAGMHLVSGRTFDDARDIAGQPLVIVVNDTLATRYFPDGNAVGTAVDLWGARREIVGVVQGIHDSPAAPDVRPAFWFPLAQVPQPSTFGAVRSATSDPAGLAALVRTVVAEVDPDLPLSEVRTLADRSDSVLAGRRFTLGLLQAFAVTALVLTAAGIYGMLAYVVRQRRRELGVRAALGASRMALGRLVLSDGLALVAMGAAVSVIAIPLGGRLLQGALFNVQPFDPPTIAGAIATLLAVASVASIGPTIVAMRSDPAAALRDD